jgi:hypothetical protein
MERGTAMKLLSNVFWALVTTGLIIKLGVGAYKIMASLDVSQIWG